MPLGLSTAEWLWPGGGIMFGSHRPDGAIDNVGRSAAYLVTPDPDGNHWSIGSHQPS